MGTLEMGSNIQDTLFLHEVVKQVLEAGGVQRQSLAEEFRDLDSNHIFDHEQLAAFDSFHISSSEFFWIPFKSSRIHIHDINAYAQSNTQVVMDFCFFGKMRKHYQSFDRIIYLETYDPKEELRKDAKDKRKNFKEYFREHYIEKYWAWFSEYFHPLAAHFGDCKLFGLFYIDLISSPEITVLRLSRFLNVNLSQEAVTKIVDWIETQNNGGQHTRQWDDYFTKRQYFTFWFIFGKVLRLYNVPYWKSFSLTGKKFRRKITNKWLERVNNQVKRRLKIYTYLTNHQFVQKLLKK